MTDNEEAAKLVDGAYKNILEKFNPSARQLISAGKAYLKALHGVVSASKAYVDALSKLAHHAHQGTWGGCADIGTALMQLVDVQKEIESQQLNILKAFYVDLLNPLELNIDKDAKIVASEQKRFLHQHKCLQDSYVKALAAVRKQRKKSKGSRSNIDKEIKNMQTLEEEKIKLDCFCERSLKQAIIQERRRFGFVLERQCSLTKHNLVYYSQGESLLQHRLPEWEDVAKGRESLPEPIDKLFPDSDDFRGCIEYSGVGGSNACISIGGGGTLRKTRSIDTSCMDIREIPCEPNSRSLMRAKSDFNLAVSSGSLLSNDGVGLQRMNLRPKSFADSEPGAIRYSVRAVYSYSANGEHQLSFQEGDIITLIGSRNKGWQYGENQRNRKCGWFPIAYTEPFSDETETNDSFDKSLSDSLNCNMDNFSQAYAKVPVTRSITAPSIHAYDFDSTYASAASSPMSGDVSIPVPGIQRQFSTFMDNSRMSDSPQQFKHDSQSLHSSPHSSNGTFTSPTTASPTCASVTAEQSLNQSHSIPASSLHGSNDSGFSNDSNQSYSAKQIISKFHSKIAAEEFDDECEKPKNNIFASVKLRKVTTNDRSAPMLS